MWRVALDRGKIDSIAVEKEVICLVPVSVEALRYFCAVYDIDHHKLTQLGNLHTGGDGVVYTYDRACGQWILKVMAVPDTQPDGLSRIEARARFAHYLSTHQVPVVHPDLSPAGRMLETFTGAGHTFVAYIMKKAPGRIIRSQNWDDALLHKLGRIIGRMHAAAKQYPDWIYPFPAAAHENIPGWQLEWQSFYTWCKDDAVKERWIAIRERLEQLPIDRSSFGFIHNDPHSHNMLVDGANITVLDFDVANCHWFATDIAIATQSILFELSGGLDRPLIDPAPLQQFLTHFKAGYHEENALASEWWTELDLFISYRRILLFIVLYDQLVKNAVALAKWKQMIMTEPQLCRK